MFITLGTYVSVVNSFSICAILSWLKEVLNTDLQLRHVKVEKYAKIYSVY